MTLRSLCLHWSNDVLIGQETCPANLFTARLQLWLRSTAGQVLCVHTLHVLIGPAHIISAWQLVHSATIASYWLLAGVFSIVIGVGTVQIVNSTAAPPGGATKHLCSLRHALSGTTLLAMPLTGAGRDALAECCPMQVLTGCIRFEHTPAVRQWLMTSAVRL